MSRKKSKVVPVGNDPVPQDTSGIGRITIEEIRPIISEALDKSFDELEKTLDRMSESTDRMWRAIDQRLVDLELDARQPRLATEADIPTDKNTRKLAEDAVADQVKHGDSCSAKRVNAGPTNSTSFGMTAEPPTLPRRDDVLVNKGAEERILPYAAGGLLLSFPDRFFLGISVKRPKKYKLDKQTACPSLLEEGYSNKIKANSGVRSWRLYRSSTSLPVLGRLARVALWGGLRSGVG